MFDLTCLCIQKKRDYGLAIISLFVLSCAEIALLKNNNMKNEFINDK